MLSIDIISWVEIMPKDQQMWMQFAGTAWEAKQPNFQSFVFAVQTQVPLE